jgi:hypothetical protein
MSEKYVIIRRVTFNGVIIEDGRFIGTAPTYKQANEVASLFQDDTLTITKALVGFKFDFYVKCFE